MYWQLKKGFKFAADYCRDGKGPIFVELNTYRYHGHSMSDPGISYRSRDEVEGVRKERDCIEVVRRRLIERDWATEQELKALEKEAKKIVQEAIDFATQSSPPQAAELYTDIYHGTPPPFIRAVDYAKSVTAQQVEEQHKKREKQAS